VGEAEEMFSEFLSAYRDSGTREVLFENALRIEGIYIPRYYSVEYDDAGRIHYRKARDNAPEIIRKRTFMDVTRSSLKTAIITPEAEFSDMYLLEAMRGCVWSCRFCVAGRIYKPPRRKDLSLLKEEIKEALTKTRRVGLIGPSLSDYPRIEEVLSMEGVDFSITSLRASPGSGRIVQLLKGHRSVSIAPEAGTERLRSVINKNITDRDIMETAKLILGSGVATLRLYFMIGLPSETRVDVDEIINMVGRIREDNRKGFITLSVSTFVPKPFTPFQWHPMESMKEVKERLKIIKKGLSRMRGVKVFHDVPKYAYMQGLFALGDRRTGRMIEQAAFEGGLKWGHKSMNIGRDLSIFRKKEITGALPWDFIDIGISRDELWNEYRSAMSM
ncbi:MAG: radical SAM protein, partial [Nitrospirota bacterium]|nr:radical SAM protein [Nitrospirota bacterium]